MNEQVRVAEASEAFGIQPPLLPDFGLLGLICPHCGKVHDAEQAWVIDYAGHHSACPHCALTSQIPRRIEP